MNFRAEATFRAGDWSRVIDKLLPRVTAAVTAGTDAAYEESQVLCPVDTGNLHDTALTRVKVEGEVVRGEVVYPAAYAAYVEFGVGQRGAASANAGPYAYGDRPGFAGFAYLRGGLDAARPAIKAAYADAGFSL